MSFDGFLVWPESVTHSVPSNLFTEFAANLSWGIPQRGTPVKVILRTMAVLTTVEVGTAGIGPFETTKGVSNRSPGMRGYQGLRMGGKIAVFGDRAVGDGMGRGIGPDLRLHPRVF